jgi:hypothetical protein
LVKIYRGWDGQIFSCMGQKTSREVVWSAFECEFDVFAEWRPDLNVCNGRLVESQL